MSSKKLFLDIDGVLNTDPFLEKVWVGREVPDYSIYLMPEKISLLKDLIGIVSDYQLILHSTWGRWPGPQKTTEAFEKLGFTTPVSFTPKKLSSSKVHEVQFCLDGSEESIIIIDDVDFSFDYMKRQYPQIHIVQPDPAVGLTAEHLNEIKNLVIR